MKTSCEDTALFQVMGYNNLNSGGGRKSDAKRA